MQLQPVPSRRSVSDPSDRIVAPKADVSLHSPVVAMPRCGVFMTLRSVSEASAYLHRYWTGERARDLDFIRTERLLELAAASPTRGVRQTATVALQSLLRRENMLGEAQIGARFAEDGTGGWT